MRNENESNAARPPEAARVILLILALLILPTALTLRTVESPGALQVVAANPTPLGYTWSLLLFAVPLGALVFWFRRRPELRLQRRAFWRTIAILLPTGFVLDLLLAHRFFTFANTRATLGLNIPGLGGPIPIEEFIFYLCGFMVVLLTYIWCDEYWMAAYNIPDYHAAAKDLRRLARFHAPSVVLGVVLLGAAVGYRRQVAHEDSGFPWYLTYLLFTAIVPAAGFFRNAREFINWRGFSFTLFFVLLLSLLWEVTLAIPYGWWGYRSEAMTGLFIGAWSHLPVEAVGVWIAVVFVTIITYEVVKIWQALGRRALDVFFGIRSSPRR